MNSLFVRWDVSPSMFHLGSLDVRWYGVLFAMSFVWGYILMKKMFTKENVPDYYLDRLYIYVFIGLLVGLRLGHCLFYEGDVYLRQPLKIILPFDYGADFWDFAKWKFTGYQGLASHGGAIGLLIALFMYARKFKIPYLWILDRLIIIIAFGGLFIRMGNLMNSEIYGHVTTMPWGFIFVRRHELLPKHPTQLYEGISYVLLACALLFYYWKKNGKPKPGILFGAFLAILFSLRFVIEFWKENQVGFEESMPINMGQLLSLPFIVAGIVIWIMAYKGKFKEQPIGDPEMNKKLIAQNNTQKKKK